MIWAAAPRPPPPESCGTITVAQRWWSGVDSGWVVPLGEQIVWCASGQGGVEVGTMHGPCPSSPNADSVCREREIGGRIGNIGTRHPITGQTAVNPSIADNGGCSHRKMTVPSQAPPLSFVGARGVWLRRYSGHDMPAEQPASAKDNRRTGAGTSRPPSATALSDSDGQPDCHVTVRLADDGHIVIYTQYIRVLGFGQPPSDNAGDSCPPADGGTSRPTGSNPASPPSSGKDQGGHSPDQRLATAAQPSAPCAQTPSPSSGFVSSPRYTARAICVAYTFIARYGYPPALYVRAALSRRAAA